MVKLAYIFLFVIVLNSCASQNRTDKHVLDSSLLNKIEKLNKEISSNTSEFVLSTLFEFEDMEINIKRYDTQAQPDSLGHYPLKEEETRKSKKNIQKEDQKQKEEQKEEKEEYQSQITSENNIETIENIQSSTDIGSPFNLNWFWLLIIPFIVYYLIKKFGLKK